MASLEAKSAALETVYRLSFALDALNYHEVAPLFYPDKKFNFDISALLGKPAQDVTAAEYFDAAVGGLGGFDATQHVVTNPIVSMNDNGTMHVKVMVSALHGLFIDGGLESAIARVTWNIDLEKDVEQWLIIKMTIGKLVPIDRLDIWEKGQARGHDGKLRASIVRS